MGSWADFLTLPPNGGPIAGAPALSMMTGFYYMPHLFVGNNTAATTTTNRIIYIPVFFPQAVTLSACVTSNSGTSDNGKKYRVGIYTHGPTGPTTLLGSFGEVTLTGATARRTLTANVVIPSAGWYWAAIHSDSAMDLYQMIYIATGRDSAGVYGNNGINYMGLIGRIDPGLMDVTNQYTLSPCMYVDTTYAALASTAVAPTGAMGGQFIPSMVFKV